MSTVRAAATCLTRWRRRGLTRAAARHAGQSGGGTAMSYGGGGTPITGGTGGGILQCRRRRERVRRTPLVSHDARRIGLPRRRRLDAGVARR
jgi:hypothetical protein